LRGRVNAASGPRLYLVRGCLVVVIRAILAAAFSAVIARRRKADWNATVEEMSLP